MLNENEVYVNDYLSYLSQQLKKIRCEKNLTQQELADKTNLTLNYIAKLESNSSKTKKIPTLRTLILISKELEVPLSLFFTKEKDINFITEYFLNKNIY